MENLLTYIQDRWVEITGAIITLIYLYLSINQKVSLWIFGLLSSLLYIVVFFQTKFYADMSLQFYYVFVSIYGWINWKRGKTNTGDELPIIRTTKRMGLQVTVASVLIYIVYYLILSRCTDSTIPVSDSIVGTLSVVATWMLVRKMLDNWLVWIVADGLATGLFIYKSLYPTAALYVVYTIMAIVGYWQWKKTSKTALQ